jgi:hypothetical protein
MPETVKLGVAGGGAAGPLLGENEAIEALGLSGRPNPKGALRWLMRTRRLAYVRLARGMYGFRREDLADLISACRVPASGEAKEKSE